MKSTLCILTFLSAFGALAAGGGSSAGVPNPASVNCTRLGGALESHPSAAGEYALCVIDEWRLYRAMDRRGLVIHHHYGTGGMPNPASVNCGDIGGHLRIVETPAGQAGYCAIEEWALFRAIDVTREKR